MLRILLLLLLALPVFGASTLTGQVVGIADGDTLTLLVDRKQMKIRLAEIDTPERGQPFGTQAKQALSEFAYGKEARVVVVVVDRYGRTVGRVYVDGLDVNAELVRQGYAWVYRKYAKDPQLYELEEKARKAARGLWAHLGPIPPWDWRRGERERRTGRTETPRRTDFTCGTKRYCREMTSCVEARFYLEQCGLTRLDGDNDREPCERICR